MITSLKDVVHWRLDRGQTLEALSQEVAGACRLARRRRNRLYKVIGMALIIIAIGPIAARHVVRPALPTEVITAAPLSENREPSLRNLAGPAREARLPPFVHTRVVDRGRLVCEGTTDAFGRMMCDLPSGRYTVILDSPGQLNPIEMDVTFVAHAVR